MLVTWAFDDNGHDGAGSINRARTGSKEVDIEDKSKLLAKRSQKISHVEEEFQDADGEKKSQMPPSRVMTRLILTMVWRKLARDPNTYASVVGVVWSLISFRWDIKMPTIVSGSVTILSNTGLGMAMFSLGLFMALQPKIIACGKRFAILSMVARFLAGPAVMAATSFAVGLRGDLLRVAVIQAALPQGVLTFVYANEYDVRSDILCTAVSFGTVAALPITILYYLLLGL